MTPPFQDRCNCGGVYCEKCNKELRQKLFCISCGDMIFQANEYPPEVQDAMRARCRACALEVLGIAIPFVGTLQHDTGGGRRVIRDTKTQ